MSSQSAAFAFDLHLFCGGYAYYSTYTKWADTKDSGREVRKPSMVLTERFIHTLETLGHHGIVIENESDLQYWLHTKRGWALASEAVAAEMMNDWIAPRVCLKSAVDRYVDVAITRPTAEKHRIHPATKQFVRERDAERCVKCGRTESADGVLLTMHHVRAHSDGGETTSSNLVALCEECHGPIGAEHNPEFYELAGLPHTFDRSLLKSTLTRAAWVELMKLGDNLMTTRCDIY